MSLLAKVRRYAAEYQDSIRSARTLRMINALPPEIRKDIGWPDAMEAHVRLKSRLPESEWR
jgi:hypothetical protein